MRKRGEIDTMQGGGRARLRVVAAILLAGLLGTAVVATRQAAPSSRAGAVDGKSPAAARNDDSIRFYGEVRGSLAPLLQHARILPKTLAELAKTPAHAETAALAARWANDMATARDLVGRLRPPSEGEGVNLRNLYQTAVMLQLEAARTVPLAVASSTQRGRETASRAGSRLFIIGDRTFDLSRRVLDSTGDILAPDMVLPAEVPDWGREGLDEDQLGLASPDRSGFSDDPVPIDSAYAERHRGELVGAAAVLDSVRLLYRSGADSASAASSARQLQALAEQLGVSVPETKLGRAGIVAYRLALLVHAESLRALTLAGGSAAIVQAQRLRLIAERLWTTGRQLLRSAGVPSPVTVRAADLPASLLDDGGLFNGHPPPLRLGDGPDAGVPGGLPDVRLGDIVG
jgi:hypothetical protein